MLAALLLILAPAPPAQPLTEAYLVGNWAYHWGEWVGHLTLRADGTVVGCDQYEHGPSWYEGRWRVERGELQMNLGGTWCYRIRVGKVPAKSHFIGDDRGMVVYFERQLE